MNKEKENTMEFWVSEAGKGRNLAECWQNCNRILEETIQQQKEKNIKVLEHYFPYGLGCSVCRERTKKELKNLREKLKGS
jgi:Pyruvate/2-oxoacid:ferredoxin oxidoreductase delta subunit